MLYPPQLVSIFSEALGKEVNVPDRPERIVSLSPAVTETLFMLGLGDRLIGVSAFCARPEEARRRRKVGSYSTSNVDLLREMKPIRIAILFPHLHVLLPAEGRGVDVTNSPQFILLLLRQSQHSLWDSNPSQVPPGPGQDSLNSRRRRPVPNPSPGLRTKPVESLLVRGKQAQDELSLVN